MWSDDLSDIDYEDAVAAAREHFRSSTDYLMPIHIVRGVRVARTRAVTMSPETPDDCGDHLWVVDGTCAKCLSWSRREDDGHVYVYTRGQEPRRIS